MDPCRAQLTQQINNGKGCMTLNNCNMAQNNAPEMASLADYSSLQAQLYKPLLLEYNKNRQIYQKQGHSQLNYDLILGFCIELEEKLPSLQDVSLLKTISLFGQMLMMHEFEIVAWSLFSSGEVLTAIIKQDPQLAAHKSDKIKERELNKFILNHLLNTAYFTKSQVISPTELQPFCIFLETQFESFSQQYESWLQKKEPTAKQCTPIRINKRFKILQLRYHKRNQLNIPGEEEENQVIDYNKLTNKMIKESQQYSRYNYVPKFTEQSAEPCQKDQPSKKRETKYLRKQQASQDGSSCCEFFPNLSSSRTKVYIQPRAKASSTSINDALFIKESIDPTFSRLVKRASDVNQMVFNSGCSNEKIQPQKITDPVLNQQTRAQEQSQQLNELLKVTCETLAKSKSLLSHPSRQQLNYDMSGYMIKSDSYPKYPTQQGQINCQQIPPLFNNQSHLLPTQSVYGQAPNQLSQPMWDQMLSKLQTPALPRRQIVNGASPLFQPRNFAVTALTQPSGQQYSQPLQNSSVPTLSEIFTPKLIGQMQGTTQLSQPLTMTTTQQVGNFNSFSKGCEFPRAPGSQRASLVQLFDFKGTSGSKSPTPKPSIQLGKRGSTSSFSSMTLQLLGTPKMKTQNTSQRLGGAAGQVNPNVPLTFRTNQNAQTGEQPQ